MRAEGPIDRLTPDIPVIVFDTISLEKLSILLLETVLLVVLLLRVDATCREDKTRKMNADSAHPGRWPGWVSPRTFGAHSDPALDLR